MATTMKRVFAILQEPASYTVDRNKAVYDQLGIEYCYIDSKSEAISNISNVTGLSGLSKNELKCKLIEILRNYDIIIFNGYTGRIFKYLFILNHKYQRKIGIDSDTQLRIPTNPVKRLLKWTWLSMVFKNKNYYGLAGGSGSHKELFRHYGMSERRICLMPMVVNNDRFMNINIKSESDCFRFLYVGRIISVKNIPTMLDAFVKSFNNRNNVQLRVVGKGDMLQDLKNKYKSYPNIVFTGAKYSDELTEEYHNASAFILPSSYEPWGLVVNEAMAAGLPVIVSDQVGAAHDLVEGHNTGFIFPYQDSNRLSEQMKTLVEDKKLYKEYSRNAANRMTGYWNYDLYTKCLKDFIEKASESK